MWPSLVNSSQRITFPLTNTNSSSVSTRPLAHGTQVSRVLNVFQTQAWHRFSAGRGGDFAEPSRCPCLCPSTPLGAFTKPLCVFWKTGRQVRNHNNTPAYSFFPQLTLTVFFTTFLFQVSFRKLIQHQYKHKHLRVPGSQKSSKSIVDLVAFQEIGESAAYCAANHCPVVRGSDSMWKLFVSNSLSVCVTDIANEEQYRLCRRLNQALCVQPPPAAWRSQVFQHKIYSHWKPQRLLPPHSQVIPHFNVRN